MKYFSWALVIACVCGSLCFSACYFNKPAIMVGLVGVFFIPNPFSRDEEEEEEDES